MSAILVSPTEPANLRRGCKTSSLPERYGVDFLIFVRGRKVGIQRKEIGDLIASLYDTRLARELILMKRLNLGAFVIEGKPNWTTDGQMISDHWKSFSRQAFYNLIASLQLTHGHLILATNNTEDTEAAVKSFKSWLEKDEHGSLTTRSKPVPAYIHRSDRDWGLFLLQGFPGIGQKMAGAIFDHFGYAPLSWDVTKEQLMEIEGIGSKKAEQVFRILSKEVSKK